MVAMDKSFIGSDRELDMLKEQLGNMLHADYLDYQNDHKMAQIGRLCYDIEHFVYSNDYDDLFIKSEQNDTHMSKVLPFSEKSEKPDMDIPF